MEKAIKAYEKSLKINFYSPNSWFTLGCAYLRQNDFQNAIRSFSSVVQIDDTQGEAWANLSTCFNKVGRFELYKSLKIFQIGKKTEAYNTLELAVRHNENSWRMWQNLLYVSLENKKFATYCRCIETLVRLEKVKKCVGLSYNIVFDSHFREK
jgi:tetratricopeptide (TPR) repeat protein